LKTVARELGECKLDLVGVQEVKWEKGGTERAEDYTFLYAEGNEDQQLGTDYFVHKRIISAVRRVKFESYRMSYTPIHSRRKHGHRTENTETLLNASKKEVNPEKTKYVLVSRCEKVGQKHSVKIVSRCFEVVAKFKYLGTTLTDQNCMNEEIKSRLNSGNTCHHSVQSLLSSHLLSRNVKVKIYKAIILPVVCVGVKLGLSH
jgi:hypothetical protein